MFQVIFNSLSAAELAKLPKDRQLQVMGKFQDVPKDLATDSTAHYGKFTRGGRHFYRLRIGDYRLYFERVPEGVLVHLMLHKNTLKDFLFRFKIAVAEDEDIEKRPEFWRMIDEAGQKQKAAGAN
jgi:mRNA-degrading endonuclease RelE of RelBE toxin-antitoxin system